MVLFTSFSDDNLDLNVLNDDIRHNDNNIDNYHAHSREKDLRISDVAFESPFPPGFPGFKHSPEKCPNIDFYSHYIGWLLLLLSNPFQRWACAEIEEEVSWQTPQNSSGFCQLSNLLLTIALLRFFISSIQSSNCPIVWVSNCPIAQLLNCVSHCPIVQLQNYVSVQ